MDWRGAEARVQLRTHQNNPLTPMHLLLGQLPATPSLFNLPLRAKASVGRGGYKT